MTVTTRSIFHSLIFLSLSFIAMPALSGDIEKGKEKSQLCAGCHGADGISVSPIIPNLAGQKEEYMINSIKAYKSGERKNGIMSSVVGAVKDNDIEDIAAYYSSLNNAIDKQE